MSAPTEGFRDPELRAELIRLMDRHGDMVVIDAALAVHEQRKPGLLARLEAAVESTRGVLRPETEWRAAGHQG